MPEKGWRTAALQQKARASILDAVSHRRVIHRGSVDLQRLLKDSDITGPRLNHP